MTDTDINCIDDAPPLVEPDITSNDPQLLMAIIGYLIFISKKVQKFMATYIDRPVLSDQKDIDESAEYENKSTDKGQNELKCYNPVPKSFGNIFVCPVITYAGNIKWEDLKYESMRFATFLRAGRYIKQAPFLARFGFFYVLENERIVCRFCDKLNPLFKGHDSGIIHDFSVGHRTTCPMLTGNLSENIPRNRANINDVTSQINGNEIILTKPSRSSYSRYLSRVNSFPPGHPLAESLANAGFYFMNSSVTRIQCFWCDLSLEFDFMRNPVDIWRLHATLSGECGYLRLRKGPNFMKHHFDQASGNQIMYLKESIQSGLQERGVDVTPPSCIECRRRDRDVVFLPCGHILVCADCASTAMCCKCGKEITGKAHVSF